MTLSVTDRPTSTAPSGLRLAMGLARLLLALIGTLGVAATAYFTLWASPQEGGVESALDWFVAVWSLLVHLGFVTVSLWPGLRRLDRARLAGWLLLSHATFEVVKLVGYDEVAPSLTFMALDAVIVTLLLLATRPGSEPKARGVDTG